MRGSLLTLVVGSIFCTPGVLSGPLKESEAQCIDVSNDVDVWVEKSNEAITMGGDDTVDADNLEKTMRLHFLGIPLPLTVHIEASHGLLSSMDQLRRISPAYLCMNDSHTNYTSGTFKYRDMEISYKRMKAKFLIWEIGGKLTHQFQPEFNLVVKKSTDPLDNDCGPEPLTLTSPGLRDYIVETDDSWKSWFLKKVVHHALVGDENSHNMLQSFLQRAWASLNNYYCTFSC